MWISLSTREEPCTIAPLVGNRNPLYCKKLFHHFNFPQEKYIAPNVGTINFSLEGPYVKNS